MRALPDTPYSESSIGAPFPRINLNTVLAELLLATYAAFAPFVDANLSELLRRDVACDGSCVSMCMPRG